MFRRSIPLAFRPMACPRASLGNSIVPLSARRFSATPSYGVSSVFAETENPMLNETLTVIQERIILPAYLPEKQQKLILDPKMTTYLQQNPVVIELEGIEHKFSTMSRFKDIPNSKKIFYRALSEMETREEWENLGTLLSGYKKAGIKLRQKHYSYAIRKAGQKGSIFTVIECAKQSQKTGLVLHDVEHVSLILLFTNKKIVNNNGDAEQISQAYKWSKIVLDLLQRPEHMLNKPLVEKLHMSPIVRGLILFTEASAFQAKQVGEEPVEADLRALSDNAELLQTLWARADIDNIAATPDLEALRARVSASSYVAILAQNIKGLALAREVIGESASNLKGVEDALSSHLKGYVTEAGQKLNDLFWIQEYEETVGQKPDWPAAPARKVSS